MILYSFDRKSQSKIFTHPCPPYALAFTAYGIFAGGCDQRIVTYTDSGRQLQLFDYGNEQNEKEFTVAVRDPSGQNVVVGSFDRFVNCFFLKYHRAFLKLRSRLCSPCCFELLILKKQKKKNKNSFDKSFTSDVYKISQ